MMHRTPLEKRPLGSHSLLVTPIGLGLAALGRPGYINLGHARDLDGEYEVAAMERHAHEVLDLAWDLGIRYFDAARSYGRAEHFLGRWLRKRGISSSEVSVGSKWGYTYTADWRVDAEIHEVKEHSLATLERQWKESRDLLGDHLDLYQIHSATLESGVLDNREVLSALARLQEEGTAIGLTLSGEKQAIVLEKALAIEIDGAPLFRSVQATWNLLERSAAPMLAEAHNRGLGVIVKEVLANGRLTPRNDDPLFAPQMMLLRAEAARLGTTVDALALAAALAQPWADVVLSGAATREHLASNIAALNVPWDEAASTALQVLAEPPESYWKTRGKLAWN